MIKLTKRKGFNFFRSYYDVFNELEDTDKLDFIKALLDKQFLGINPTDLKGMAKFAWISQTNSIDSQVKGYEDKTGVKLTPTDGGKITPTEQVEGKVEVEGKVQDVGILSINSEWRNQFLKHYTINLEEYNKKLSAFSIAYDMERPEKELKQHFFNWFKTQDYKKQEEVVEHWNKDLVINVGKFKNQ